MHVAVELSLYPLAKEFVPPIVEFVGRLQARPGLAVVTNSMSTQLSGELDAVFDALRAEIGRAFREPHRSVFVMKVLGGAD